eukprot:303336_1
MAYSKHLALLQFQLNPLIFAIRHIFSKILLLCADDTVIGQNKRSFNVPCMPYNYLVHCSPMVIQPRYSFLDAREMVSCHSFYLGISTYALSSSCRSLEFVLVLISSLHISTAHPSDFRSCIYRY